MTEKKKEILSLYKWFNTLKEAVEKHTEGLADVKTIATHMVKLINHDLSYLDKPSAHQIQYSYLIIMNLYSLILVTEHASVIPAYGYNKGAETLLIHTESLLNQL